MPPLNLEYWKQLWDTQIETLEKLREHVAAQDVEIAVIKTKIAFIACLSGLVGGSIGSLFVGLILYIVKK